MSQTGDPGEQRRDAGTARVLVHLGMHKTASSWLQENLFGRTDTGFWVNAPTDVSPKRRAKAGTDRFFQNDRGGLLESEEFDPDGLRHQLGLSNMPRDRCAVLSNERLSGHPLSNGIDRLAICQRIASVLPHARILIVIREQQRVILSNYMQYLHNGGPFAIDHYLRRKGDGRMPSLSLNFWKYDRLCRLYQKQFGIENTLVLPYELLASEPSKFVERICSFAGLPMPEGLPFARKTNARGDYFSYTRLRLMSPLLRSSIGNAYAPSLLGPRQGRIVHTWLHRALARLVPAALDRRVQQHLLEQIEEIVGNTYVHSNLATRDLTGLDLARYGYRVA